MSKEDKDLLTKDLSARLPYGVKIHIETPEYGELIGILDAVYPAEKRVIVDELDKAIALINVRCGGFEIEENKVKPYLRPISSMTEEEMEEYNNIDNRAYSCPEEYAHIPAKDRIDWLNAHYFDYRGLIEKGLALEAPEGMYNIKQK